jgi:two-component system, response regulator PdtaR
VARSKLVVLVVEDEAFIRMAIADHLTDLGYKVLEASNADLAIDILAHNLEIRLVFTDVDMPGAMDGLKLAAAVRKRWPPVKIIVTSGHREVAVADLPVEARFMPKPYSPDDVAAAFEQMLN